MYQLCGVGIEHVGNKRATIRRSKAFGNEQIFGLKIAFWHPRRHGDIKRHAIGAFLESREYTAGVASARSMPSLDGIRPSSIAQA